MGPLLAAPVRQRGPGDAALRQRHGGNPRGEGRTVTQGYVGFLGSPRRTRRINAAVSYFFENPRRRFLMLRFLNALYDCMCTTCQLIHTSL